MLMKKTRSDKWKKRPKMTTHWLSRTRFLSIYRWILSRCNNSSNKSYSRYWARGILCLWGSIASFKKDMYEDYLMHVETYWEINTTIDRIDNNGNYCKDNCRWATRKEQWKNTNFNVRVVYECCEYTLTELSEKTWTPKSTLSDRYKRNDKLIKEWPILITVDGVTKKVSERCEELWIYKSRIYSRIKKWIDVESFIRTNI